MPDIAKRDFRFVGLYVLLSLVLLFQLVTTAVTPQAVNIYINIFFVSIILIIIRISAGKGNPIADFEFFGDDSSLQLSQARTWFAIIVGLIFGLAFIANLFPQVFSLNTDFIPQLLSQSPVSVVTAQTAILVILIGPFSEELFFRDILNPTFKKMIKGFGLNIMLIFFGVILGFLFNNLAIGALIVLLGLLVWFSPSTYSRIIGVTGAVSFIAYSMSSILFGAYHLFSYSNLISPQNAVISAAIFGMVVSYENDFTGTGLASHITHGTVNAGIFVSLGLSLLIAATILGVYILLILMMDDIRKFYWKPQIATSIGL